MKALVVEDDYATQLIIGEILKACGHQPKTVTSAEEAQEIYTREGADIVILDWLLPGMSGLDFCRWLRYQPQGDRPYVLMATAKDKAQDLHEVLSSGANDYIAKPLDFSLLKIRLLVANQQVQLMRQRHAMEDAMRESEERFRSMANSAPVMLWMSKPEVQHDFFNDTWLDFRGYDMGHEMGEGWLEGVHPDDVELCRALHQNKFTNLANFEIEYRLLRHDGEFRWILETGRPYGVDGNTCIGYVGSCVDITDQKRTNDELRVLGEAIRSINEVVVITDAELDPPGPRIIFVNEAFTQQNGYTAEEVIGRTPRILQGERTDPELLRRMKETLRNGLPFRAEGVNYRKDGSSYEVDIQVSPVRDAGNNITHYIAIERDLTDRHKQEREMLRSAKLESLGLLAGGIAHDFNNILMTIGGNIALAKTQLSAGDNKVEFLSEAEAATRRAADLSHQLLTFSKGGEPLKSVCDIGELLRKTVSFNLRGSKVKMEFDFQEDLWPARVDENQISQVIDNLVINGREAMPQGGILRVRAWNEVLTEPFANVLPPGEYVRFSVTDEGVGIAPEILGKIFDPYFTTKETGTGLGLAAVYSICRRHQGLVTIDSPPGEGATFCVYLPATHAKVKKHVIEAHAWVRGSGRVLIMDDEATIRKVMRRTLMRLGYEVEEAQDGQEALDLHQKALAENHPFSVVCLDLTIPGGMGGDRVIGPMHELDPEIKAVACSGYSDNPIIANYRDHGFCAVLRKPFNLHELAEKMGELTSGHFKDSSLLPEMGRNPGGQNVSEQ
jgi:PAS domain S-box-containing protein